MHHTAGTRGPTWRICSWAEGCLRMKPIELAKSNNIDNFKGNPSWCYHFMKRKNLAIRQRTTLAQQLPADHIWNIVESGVKHHNPIPLNILACYINVKGMIFVPIDDLPVPIFILKLYTFSMICSRCFPLSHNFRTLAWSYKKLNN